MKKHILVGAALFIMAAGGVTCVPLPEWGEWDEYPQGTFYSTGNPADTAFTVTGEIATFCPPLNRQSVQLILSDMEVWPAYNRYATSAEPDPPMAYIETYMWSDWLGQPDLSTVTLIGDRWQWDTTWIFSNPPVCPGSDDPLSCWPPSRVQITKPATGGATAEIAMQSGVSPPGSLCTHRFTGFYSCVSTQYTFCRLP
jgi:hypothetical protein